MRACVRGLCVCVRVCMCSGSAVRCPPSVVLKSAHRPAYCFTIAAMQETTKKPSSRTIVLEISHGSMFAFKSLHWKLGFISDGHPQNEAEFSQSFKSPPLTRILGLIYMSWILKFHNLGAVMEYKWAVGDLHGWYEAIFGLKLMPRRQKMILGKCCKFTMMQSSRGRVWWHFNGLKTSFQS